MRWFGKVLGVAIVAGMAGACQGPQGEPPDTSGHDGATVRLALSGADFSGHSVQVVGRRVDAAGQLRPADSQYRCDNSFDRCFDLSGSAPTLNIPGLCASTDFPQNGYWTFEYALHTGPCAGGRASGERLNDDDSATDRYNLQCYDSDDLYTRSPANQSWQETLQPGRRHRPGARHRAGRWRARARLRLDPGGRYLPVRCARRWRQRQPAVECRRPMRHRS